MRIVNRPTGIVIDPPVADFGDVVHEEQLDAQFAVYNYTSKAVTLDKFTPSCGCISLTQKVGDSAVPVPGPVKIGPGELATFQTGMTSGTMQGTVSGTVVFQTDSVEMPLGKFEMRANLHGRLHTVPSTLALGDVTLGQRKQVVFVLTDGGRRKPFDLSHIECTIPSASVESQEIVDPSTVDVGGKPLYEVQIDFLAQQVGAVGGEVRFFSKEKDAPELEVPITGRVVPQWIASPPAVVFPQQGVATPYALSVHLNDETGRPVPFTLSAESVPAWLEAGYSEDAASPALRLEVISDARSRARNSRLQLHPLNVQSEEEAVTIELPVFVIADEAAASGEGHAVSSESP